MVAFVVSILFVTAAIGMVQGATPATVTLPGEANMRSGAGTSFSVLRTGHKGEKYEVVGSAKDSSSRTWYKVKVGTGFGYVAGWLVTYTPAKSSPPSPAASTSTQKSTQTTPAATTRYAVATEDGNFDPDRSRDHLRKVDDCQVEDVSAHHCRCEGLVGQDLVQGRLHLTQTEAEHRLCRLVGCEGPNRQGAGHASEGLRGISSALLVEA